MRLISISGLTKYHLWGIPYPTTSHPSQIFVGFQNFPIPAMIHLGYGCTKPFPGENILCMTS
jgi:hypothetical protein